MLRSIDLSISPRLKDREFRREWFRAELEESVPTAFRELRERRGLTQAELATLTGMKQSAISRFESSYKAKWKIDTLLKLADALDGRFYIGLEAFEDVVERVATEEKRALLGFKCSVLQASPIEDLNVEKRVTANAAKATSEAKRSVLDDESDHTWK